MSKNKKNKEFVMPVEEAFAEGIISEEAVTAAEDIFAEPVILGPIEVIEEQTEENKPAVILTEARPGVVTNCHRLNIRKEPSLNAEILRAISKGDVVGILDGQEANGWLPVILSDGTKGYTMKDYIN